MFRTPGTDGMYKKKCFGNKKGGRLRLPKELISLPRRWNLLDGRRRHGCSECDYPPCLSTTARDENVKIAGQNRVAIFQVFFFSWRLRCLACVHKLKGAVFVRVRGCKR